MKNFLLFVFAAIIICSCSKNDDITSVISSSGISDSKGGGGGNNSGFLQSIISGTASRLIGTHSDSILLSFTQAAPVGCWTLRLSSSDPSAVQVFTNLFCT